MLLFVLSTVDEIQSTSGPILEYIELGAIILFTIEYILRVWSCIEAKEAKKYKNSAWRGKNNTY